MNNKTINRKSSILPHHYQTDVVIFSNIRRNVTHSPKTEVEENRQNCFVSLSVKFDVDIVEGQKYSNSDIIK